MINIEVFSQEKAWSKKLRKKKLFFKKICKLFPRKYKFPNKKITLTLLLSNNRGIKKLNKNFRNKNKSTDILSFPFTKKTLISKKTYIGDIEIAPLAFMRGRTLKNSFAILDEAQNATDTQIKMFLTRIGENSKIVVNGDPTQIDLPNKGMSGLVRSKELLGHLNEIAVVNFDHSDVVRHPLVSKIVKAYSSND